MSEFPLPRRLHNARGDIRRVGIELEFAGVDIDQICAIIVELYGGSVSELSRFEKRVVGTAWGDFDVEIDLLLLKERSYLKFLDFMGVDLSDESLAQAEDLLARVASTLVPHEIGSPPLPMTEAWRTERLRERLQQAHALGTKASLRYAFSLQFNPEAPAFDADTLLAYLRAFLLLVDWLQQRSQVAIARRLSPFVNDFPQAYVRRVLDPGYRPSIEQLIDDYVDYNPTRNRPLDMLPLLAHIAGERVCRDLGEHKVKNKPRPTFHYRLPNCLIDDPDWTIAQEWAGWVAVDDLAQAPDKLAAMSEDFQRHRSQWTLGYDEGWANRVADTWLERGAR